MTSKNDIKKRLQKKAYFDEDKKIPLPFLPERLGIITSPTGSVVHDIINRVKDRFPMPLDIWPVSVQGVDAADSIINAIQGFNKLKSNKPDIIIVARGGGSTEDLMAFNDENLAREIYASNVPTVTGIGHAPDITIADYICDLHTNTPTDAGISVTPDKNELYQRFDNLEEAFIHKVESKIKACANITEPVSYTHLTLPTILLV